MANLNKEDQLQINRELAAALGALLVDPPAVRADIIQSCVDRGADLTEVTTSCVSRNRHMELKLLLDNCPDFFAENERNNFLYLAVSNEQKDVAALLIDYGADVNYVNTNNMSMLSIASMQGANAIAELLLSKGAEINHELKGFTALTHAVGNDSNEEMVRLLIENGADVNLCAPLLRAAMEGNTHYMLDLLKAGAQADATDSLGKTALIYLAARGRSFIMNQMDNLGIYPDPADLQSESTRWMEMDHEIAEALLVKGVDAQAMDNNGMTALDYAVKQNQPNIAELLINVYGDELDSEKLKQLLTQADQDSGRDTIAMIENMILMRAAAETLSEPIGTIATGKKRRL